MRRSNTLAELIVFFGSGPMPLTQSEFFRFWASLTLIERLYLRSSPLD